MNYIVDNWMIDFGNATGLGDARGEFWAWVSLIPGFKNGGRLQGGGTMLSEKENGAEICPRRVVLLNRPK